MNAEVKAQWLNDLRSGEFPQVEGKLSDGEGYCCLGVLCEQAVKAGVIPKVDTPDGVRYGPDTDFSWGALPQAVVDWAELPGIDPHVMVEDPEVDDGEWLEALSGVNDDLGKNFAQIADLIEEQL